MDHSISRPFSGPAALALALALAAPAARAEITPPAAKVVARYLDAVGGADVVRSVHSSHFRGSIEAFGLKGSTEAWSRAPDHQTARTEIGPFKLLNGYDGARAWRTDPTGKVSTLDGKDLEQAKADAYFENDQWLMPDQGGGKVAVVEEPEAGKDWTVLEVTPPVGRARRCWFRNTTGLLDKVVVKHDQQTVVNTFSDYRPFAVQPGGKPRLVARTQVTQVVGMSANDVTVHLDTLETNLALDDALFASPAPAADVITYLKTPGTARLPFEYMSHHVWLKASVNGQPPADFIYDTGASVTVIDSAFAARIGLERLGSLQSQGAGAAGSASLSSLQSLRVQGPDGDGVEMKGQRVAILSVNPFLAPFFWRDCAGIIGYDFITRFVNEIDFDHRALTLRDPSSFKYTGGGTAFPMKLAGTVPVVTMKLDDQFEGEFRLDVGSSSTVDLHTPFVNQHGLREKAKPAVEAMGGGFGGTFTTTLTRTKKLSIGPYSWNDPIVALSSTTTGALASEDYAGNVGNQILERFSCTFDYDHKTVYLEPGKNYAKRDKFSRSGTQLARFGDTVKALQVLKGSPAEKAGIREGDVIVAVDGRPITSWKPEQLQVVFEDRPVGSKVRIDVVHEGKKKKATVKLADLL